MQQLLRYNNRRRKNNEAKKIEKTSTMATRFPSEYQTFQERSIFLLQNIDRINDSDLDFFVGFSEKCRNFHQAIKYPPTNSFLVCELSIEGASTDIEKNICMIHSKLPLFLCQMKGIILRPDTDVKIHRDEKYKFNKSLRVTLPENVKLSYKEIESFLTMLVGNSERDLQTQVQVYIADTSPPIREILVILASLMSKRGLNLSTTEVKFSLNEDSLVISLPEGFGLSKAESRTLQHEVSAHLFKGE